ncbi:MAG: ATP-grasp fold amidoligase family protein [Fusobacterium sp.]
MFNIIKSYLKKFSYIRFIRLKLLELKFKIFYLSDKKKENYIQKKFKEYLGYEVDFSKEPITFNQKIQFRKLYDDNPLYYICADKYRVREYVKEKIGEEYLIPLYLVTDKLTEEQWDKLPNSFVAKANHNSGPVQIIKDKTKVNKKEIIRELNNQLKFDYGILSMEKYYSDIPRKIIVEKFLKDNERKMLQDIKIHCFNDGKSKRYFFDLCSRESVGGEVLSVLYDENWTNLKVTAGNLDIKDYEKPRNLENLLEIAKKLSEDFSYVRVDLYNINEKIYFGELTFCENSGFGKFTDEEWDYKFGSYWKQKI